MGLVIYSHVFLSKRQFNFFTPTHVWGKVGSEHFDHLKALEFYFEPQRAIRCLTCNLPSIAQDLLVDVLLAEICQKS